MLRQVPVYFARLELQPMLPRNGMCQRIADMIMKHHLRGSARPRGEIYHCRIGGFRLGAFIFHLFLDLLHLFMKVRHSFGHIISRLFINLYNMSHVRTMIADLLELGDGDAVPDKDGSVCFERAEFDVLFDEEGCRWAKDDTAAETSNSNLPPVSFNHRQLISVSATTLLPTSPSSKRQTEILTILQPWVK